ncbi:hypothetical protein CDAR_407661 [Caerostris darwini]|uniref:Uncharacterized protein n=1 Tax=Caerostris darwini TaxID=1538125 RepID=A0AAV4Q3H5_9ARAC|nr:hypothetical protein CDAR_407661 [Caerostris darwini]
MEGTTPRLSRHMKPAEEEEEEDLMSGTGPDERRPCLRKWSGPAGDRVSVASTVSTTPLCRSDNLASPSPFSSSLILEPRQEGGSETRREKKFDVCMKGAHLGRSSEEKRLERRNASPAERPHYFESSSTFISGLWSAVELADSIMGGFLPCNT